MSESSKRYDLVIIGGGSGGVGAGIAAARRGVKTLIVDKQKMLGGTSVSGGVNIWEMGVGGTGIPFEIYLRMKKIKNGVGIYTPGRHFCYQDKFYWPHEMDKVNFPGGENVIDPTRRYIDTLRRHPDSSSPGMPDRAWAQEHWHGVPFEPATYHQVVTEMLAETQNCDVILECGLESVETDSNRVLSATLENQTTVTADTWIDGTGSGILCRQAGCQQFKGIDPKNRFNEPSASEAPTEKVNATTLIFRVSPTNTPAVEPLNSDIPAKLWWSKEPTASCVNHYPNGDRNINMLPTMQGAETMQLGYEKAYAECQRRIRCHWHFMQTTFPEFQNYQITWVAPFLGIRETYRTLCEYMLTENDILQGLKRQKDTDIITIADHALDRHGEEGGCPDVAEPYGIPFRCLIPKGFENLLIACRGAGFSSIAASSARLSRTMMQLGQAAGTAVALAKEEKTNLPSVDSTRLRNDLSQQHVQLAFPLIPELRSYLISNDT
jgi:hypothetical protein